MRALQPPRSGAGAAIFGVALTLVILGGVTSLLVFTAGERGRSDPTSTSKSKTESDEPFAGVSTRFMYDHAGGDPFPVRHGEDQWFLARFEVGDKQDLHVAVIDAETVKEKWRTPSFGTYSAGYDATFFTAAGGKVFVSDVKAVLHVYDLDKGKPQGTIKLTDRAKRLCASPKDDQIWVEVSDQKTVFVDIATLAVTPAKRPAWCKEIEYGVPTSWWALEGKFKGFQASQVYSDGADGAAAGSKSPGTAFPMAVGFDPVKKTPRWTMTLPSKDADTVPGRACDKAALGYGSFAAVYQQTDSQYKLTLLDAKTGDRKWDIELGGDTVGGGMPTAWCSRTAT
jgi:outer membrane protein assembly factor BamB